MNPTQFAGIKILVVDDDAEMRDAIAFDLRKRGGTIFTAANGSEALAIALESPIDIVVSDVRMPGGDGIFLLQQLRSRHPTLPIVLLCTGFADLTESEALKLGASALIEKPINRKLMMSIIENAAQAMAARPNKTAI